MADDATLRLELVIQAPRDDVFDAFLDPDSVSAW